MNTKNAPSLILVILAFAAVYIIWGSTYFFIQIAVRHIPPMILGASRFILAGIIMLLWAAYKKEKIWEIRTISHSAISGLLMLLVGTGAVIWVEQYLPSSFVAIFIASSPVWFLVLDKPNWFENFRNKFTLAGVFIGILGVICLFYEELITGSHKQSTWPLIILIIGNVGWVIGSLYSKYRGYKSSPVVSSAWQMLSAGMAFAILGLANKSFTVVQWASIPAQAWMSIAYLVVFGSIIGYSAYVFLLSVRSPAQVSSHAYVNPLVAVLLGVLFNNEKLTTLQLAGLLIILCSVMFINLARQLRLRIMSKSKP